MSTAPTVPEIGETVDSWNEILVSRFTKHRHILAGVLAHHNESVLPKLEINEGDKAVDVGCGFGDTAIELARRIGPTGSVLGIDCCEAFLEYGRQDAKAAGIDNVAFLEGEVQAFPFEPVHDFCFSRSWAQFAGHPAAGLRSTRAALRPGGIMTLIVWQTIDDNPWLGMPREIILEHLPAPCDRAGTRGPDPFSAANRGRVTRQLEIAGYDEIEFERIDAPLLVGDSPEDAVEFQLALGPAGEVYREAGAEAEARHDEIVTAMQAALAPHVTDEGVVLESSAWKVRARNPG